MTTTEDTAPEACRLSPVQEGILFHCLRAPETGAYVEQLYFDLRGVVDAEGFAAACRRVVQRHGILRTAFAWQELREPLQLVGRQAELPVEIENWSDADETERDSRFADLLEADRAAGFDLTEAPLLRLILIRLEENRLRVLLTNHHLILDGWSRGVFLSETFESYTTGEAPSRPAPDYFSFVGRTRNQDLERAANFWRETLSGFQQPTPAPGDGEDRNAGDNGSPGKIDWPLDSNTTDALTGFAREQGLTPAAVTHAAWALLTARYTNRDDVVFGTTFAGRPADIQDFECMVGLFINTLPLRVRPGRSNTVREFVTQVQSELTRLREFELTPLARIQEWSEIPRGEALFDAVFAYESLPGVSLPSGADFLAEDYVSDSRSHYPLSVAFLPGERPRLQFVFDSNRFSTDTIKTMAVHYTRLLEAIAATPDAAPAEIDCLTPGEIERELFAFNPAPRERTDLNLSGLFRRVASERSERIALDFPDETLTYGELDRRAERIARELIRRGAQPDEPVALLLERSAAFVVALLGVVKTGAPYVPVDLDQPPARARFMLTDCGARTLITDGSRPAPDDFAGDVIRLEDIVGETDMNGNGETEIAPPAPAVQATPDDPLYVMYTSGSTGQPRGIVVTHRAVERLVRDTNYIEITADDNVAQAANAAFDAATFEIWGALLNGARLTGLPRETLLQTDQLGNELREREVSILFLTTALFNLIVRDDPDAFASLRVLLFGGEQADPAAARRVLAARAPRELIHVYGPTECTTFALYHPLKTVAPDAAFLPVGRPIAETAAFILQTGGANEDSLRPAPPGVVGEICLAGPGLAREYQGLPELTAKKFRRRPAAWNETGPDEKRLTAWPRLYRTGDLGRRLPDGTIQCLGRVDFQIKLRGFRIEPGEIEAALREHNNIEEAVVMLDDRRDRESDARLIAHVRTDPATTDPAELRAFLAERLPEPMIPAEFSLHAEFPLTPSGKIDRMALERRDAGPEKTNEPTAGRDGEPGSDLERLLCDLWAEVLERESVEPDDGFFELGGHSLIAMRLISRINDALLLDVPLQTLMDTLSVSALARALRALPEGERLEETARISLEIAGLTQAEAEARLKEHAGDKDRIAP